MVPPPVLPETFTVPALKIPTFSPNRCTVPPFWLVEVAEISPLLITVSAPVKRIVPPSLTILLASILPLLLITDVINPSAAFVLISTWPLPTLIKCLFSTKVFTLALSTCTLIKPLPLKSSVMALPACIATVPCMAEITPSFRTSGASIAT